MASVSLSVVVVVVVVNCHADIIGNRVNKTETLVEGLVFMCPVVVKDVKGKSKRPAWLPTWASVDLQGGMFHFDAEWQGPIPGMDKTLRESYILSNAVQLANCNLAGLDSSTPVGGLGAQLFASGMVL